MTARPGGWQRGWFAVAAVVLISLAGLERIAAADSSARPAATPVTAPVAPVSEPVTTIAVADTYPAAGVIAASARLVERAVPCRRDGTSGNRIAFYYAYLTGSRNRLPQVRRQLVAAIRKANDLVYKSARETGGSRWLRVLTDRNCSPVITAIRLPRSAAGSFSATVNAARNARLTAANRKYVLFLDTNRLCGIATLALDDRASVMNANNTGPSWARLDRGCWTADVVAHETFHMLGAVQRSAPHYDNSGHCTDDLDLLCYQNAGGKRVYVRCRAAVAEQRLDCGKNDYFNTAPRAGNYLVGHWNTAVSSFLYGGGAARPVLPGQVASVWATMTSLSDAVLTWAPPAGSRVTSYTVFKDGSAVWQGTATVWYDGDAGSGEVTYQVRASNEAGDGAASVPVTPVLPLPPAPSNVTASGSYPVSITWLQSSTAMVAGFRIYGVRSTGTTAYLGTVSPDTRWASDHTYPRYRTWTRYRVCAYNAAGVSCTDQ